MNNTAYETALQKIREAAFALHELVLYLDTHPDCPYGLAEFRKQLEASQQARAQYVAAYGPLTQTAAAQSDRYTWLDAPWPWECEANGGRK